MSGSGGFYRYRCKYFLTHNCPNWVYVNHTACATCSSKGRETEPAATQAPLMRYPYEICVPRVEAGVMYYTLVEIDETVATGGDATGNYAGAANYAGNYGTTVGYKTNNQSYQGYQAYQAYQGYQAQPQVPTTTAALPGPPVTTTSF
ncbi:hypothetical protein GGR50DRAFT_676934 [Xylaria sp. CBS 124048]|nr:hypothetical protein GGR50DRAFT_676934 [Xylaria sp. CBS 124048]